MRSVTGGLLAPWFLTLSLFAGCAGPAPTTATEIESLDEAELAPVPACGSVASQRHGHLSAARVGGADLYVVLSDGALWCVDSKEQVSRAFGDLDMQKLLENHDFEVPKRLVAFEIEQMIKQTEQQFEQAGMSLEAAGLSREKLAQQNEELAKKRVRGDFILKKIAEAESIKLADEDMERGFKRIGDMYNMPVAKVKEFFDG